MNGQRIYFSDQNLNSEQAILSQNSNTQFQQSFRTFLHDFRRDNVRIYHQQIAAMIQHRRYMIGLQLADLKAFEDHLYERLMGSPLEVLRVMEEALRSYVRQRQSEFPEVKQGMDWQVVIRSDQNPKQLRQVSSLFVGKLFVISGLIISSTKPFIKASKLKLQCKTCLQHRVIDVPPGQNPNVPSYCPGINGASQKCVPDPYVALPDSEVVDTQHLKIQQNPQEVPSGEIARTYQLIADRTNVSKCVPGDRARITGIMLVHDIKTENLSKGSFYITGIEKIKQRSSVRYTNQEEELFKKLSKDPKIYEKIYKSVAPGIYGNEEIKKAISCMLFGGSRKHLPDNTLLRGDINILLIGDPSTAKSQFLKFVEKAASIAIYTSGKGSSAAGLTASITRDNNTGEFQIEGGALVLADGGIVCIDEFDKMKPADRVAIHEAMEQQTISVAKAGITTRLNSRTSILAAANPIHGHYDDLKQISQQIEFQTTILSRFDCIFVVRDVNTADNNQRIATHILDLHQGKIHKEENVDFPFDLLKKYINYGRFKVNPRLAAAASEKLQAIYVSDRQKSKEQKKVTRNTIPITVRQLQAIIRLSESLAKMRLKAQVGSDEVDQAHYLFEISTMKSVQVREFGVVVPENVVEDVQKIEEAIKKRICVGNQVSIIKLVEEMSAKYAPKLVEYALMNLVRNGELKEVQGKRNLLRER